MGRYKEHIRTDFKAYFQEIVAVEPQDGPTIGLEIANSPQSAIERFDTRQIGEHDEVVHLARAAVLLVDRADLHGRQKADVVPTAQFGRD